MVSVEKYKCFCVDGKRERFTSKSGRGFVKCKKETCTMFVPEEKCLDLFHVYENDFHAKFKPNKFPNCLCDEVYGCHIQQLTICGHTSDSKIMMKAKIKCGFFMWADRS